MTVRLSYFNGMTLERIIDSFWMETPNISPEQRSSFQLQSGPLAGFSLLYAWNPNDFLPYDYYFDMEGESGFSWARGVIQGNVTDIRLYGPEDEVYFHASGLQGATVWSFGQMFGRATEDSFIGWFEDNGYVNHPPFAGTTTSDDGIDGTSNADHIDALDGDDTVSASGGMDTVYGGEGSDELRGGNGNDLLLGDSGKDSLYGGTGEDDVMGGDGDDVIRGQRGGDSLEGGDGNDNIKGGGGNDTIDGGAGSDFIKGGTRSDQLSGGEGNDRIFANSFDDTLIGGAGDDTLNAGGGDDRLDGGQGDDLLKGGQGADVFVIKSGNDRIIDFDTAADRLEVSFLYTGTDWAAHLSDGNAVATSSGLVVSIGGASVTLEGLDETDIPALTDVFDYG